LSPAEAEECDRMHPDGTTHPAFARDAFISYANQDTALADALCAPDARARIFLKRIAIQPSNQVAAAAATPRTDNSDA
jgi:hypothetical protein